MTLKQYFPPNVPHIKTVSLGTVFFFFFTMKYYCISVEKHYRNKRIYMKSKPKFQDEFLSQEKCWLFHFTQILKRFNLIKVKNLLGLF